MNLIFRNVLLSCLVCIVAPNESIAQELPKDPITEQARAAYNGGKYKAAMGLFVKLSHRFPDSAAVYYALGASANQAKAYQTAVRAYTIYLELNRSGEQAQKASAELKNVRENLHSKGKEKWRQIKTHKAQLIKAINSRNLDGKNGALTIFSSLINQGYFGTDFGTLRQQTLDLITDRFGQILDAYWSVNEMVDPEALIDLGRQIKTAQQVFSGDERIRKIDAQLKAATAWQNGEKQNAINAIQQLDSLDHRLRYMMAGLLIQVKRSSEGVSLLRALSEQHQQARTLIRSEQIRLKKKRRISDEDLDQIIDTLDTLPIPKSKPL